MTTRPAFVSCFQPRADKFVDDDLELRVVVTGSPSPEITWKHNGQTMNENNARIKFLDGSRRLVVRLLTQDDAGTYSCVLKNDAGENTRSCNLIVKGNYCCEAATYSCAVALLGMIDSRCLYVSLSVLNNF